MSTKTNRLGKFSVPLWIIDNAVDGKTVETASLCALFGKCIVIEATHRYDRRHVEYLAHCEDFDETPEYMEAPWYDFESTRTEDEVAGQKIVTHDVKFG